jgi:PAS domain-containing protein
MNFTYENHSLTGLLHKVIGHKSAHIYYTFTQKDKYIKNAVDYFSFGLDHGYKIFFLEKEDIYREIYNRLRTRYTKEHLDNLIFQDCTNFYIPDGKFKSVRTTQNLSKLIDPYISEGFSIMTWGKVEFLHQDSLITELRLYELNADKYINTQKMISVCAYNGFTTPSYIQTEMLKTHEYIMTDGAVYLSTLYHENHLKVITEEEQQQLLEVAQEVSRLTHDNEELESRIAKKILGMESVQEGIAIINESRNYEIVNQSYLDLIECENKEILIGKSLNVPSEFVGITVDNIQELHLQIFRTRKPTPLGVG